MNVKRWMTVACLVVSIGAIVPSAAWTSYSRYQAHQQRRDADVEEGRRADELETQRRAELERVSAPV
jgi:hypothetical protein